MIGSNTASVSVAEFSRQGETGDPFFRGESVWGAWAWHTVGR